MPELRVGPLTLEARPGANLLDTLLAAGLPVAWSCRAGQCQTCLVQARPGQASPASTAPLTAHQQQAGWLLSCQCQVIQDMDIHLHDPASDGMGAQLVYKENFSPTLLIIRVKPDRPLRYLPGQHMALWLHAQLGRPYSIASLPTDPYLEFHLRLHSEGAFSAEIAKLVVGDRLALGASGGHLSYDMEWQDRPLLLLAGGTGLAPLQAIAREALRQGHDAPIDLWHWHSDADDGCYMQGRLLQLADEHASFSAHLHKRSTLESDLRQLRLASRSTMALVCGQPGFIEQLRKPLFMAGLPARQVLDEAFISRKA